jgi:cytochrome c oxidase accessory protein FixG
VGGLQALLIDIPARRLTLLGATFGATDTATLMLFLLTVFVGIFLLTALLGRAWCGWGCPQTVWLELLFRPLERLLEGSPQEQRARDARGPDGRRVLKWLSFAAVAFTLGNTFVAYFAGSERVLTWMRGSPSEHPTAFAVMGLVAAAVYLDFAWFREQTCQVVCPYGRFQSALVDRHSLLVGYDRRRGEPRGKPGATDGACVDCRACVNVCPQGIDIRDGFQMECVHCTQCIDACDAIMDRLGRPRGLVRYSSQAELAGEDRRWLRPRVIIYATLLAGLSLGLVAAVTLRRPAEVTQLRATGIPYLEREGGDVEVHVRLRVHNRGDARREYAITLEDPALRLEPSAPLALAPDETGAFSLTLHAPRAAFVAGRVTARLRVDDGHGFTEEVLAPLAGPGAHR